MLIVDCWEVEAIVGKSKAGRIKKAFWKCSDEQLCSKDDCTWGNAAADFFGSAAGDL